LLGPGRFYNWTTMEPPCPSLDVIAAEVHACRLCRDAPKYGAPLPHEPRPAFQVSAAARLCIAGQAPGIRVHASGRSFTDPSGVRLRQWLGIGEEIFYDPMRVAIVSMGFCFPGLDAKGGDLPPRRECAETWRARLFHRLPNLELILLVGLHAQAWHLGSTAVARGLTETVARWGNVYSHADRPRLMPIPHPSWRNNAWLKRNPWFELALLPALRADVAQIVGQCR
jgi:uracil-DNA glycosylase